MLVLLANKAIKNSKLTYDTYYHALTQALYAYQVFRR